MTDSSVKEEISMVIIIGRIGDSYFVDGLSYNIRVNGEIVVPMGKRLQIPKPVKVERILRSETVEGYESYKGERISVEEYEDMLNNAENDWAINAIREAWRPIYKRTVKYEDMDFIVVRFEERTPVEYIIPLGRIGDENQKPLYKYEPNYEKMVRKIANEMGFREGERYTSGPPHRLYDFTPRWKSITTWRGHCDLKLSNGLRVGSLESCLELYNRDLEIIKNVFLDTEKRIQLFEKEVRNVGILVMELEDVLKTLSSVRTRSRKSEELKDTAVERLRKIVKNLKYVNNKSEGES